MPSLLCMPPKHVDPPSVTGDILRCLPGVTDLYVPEFWFVPAFAPAPRLRPAFMPASILPLGLSLGIGSAQSPVPALESDDVLRMLIVALLSLLSLFPVFPVVPKIERPSPLPLLLPLSLPKPLP